MATLAGKRVWVAGHGGMVGSALLRRLAHEGCTLLTAPRQALDLRDQAAVRAWVGREKPQMVFLAAARVGGILANASRPAEFLYDNLMIEANVIDACHRAEVEKLLFLGSSCIYPKHAPQPIREEDLLSGPLEPTNEAYAVAKIAGLKLCQFYRQQYGCDYITAMPTNLYGPGDTFDAEASHVIPALILKAHRAKRTGTPFVLWGSGTPRREFLYVDDLADACLRLMTGYSGDCPINIGTGKDIAILDLARQIAEVVGFDGEIVPDPSKPDGTPRKLLDTGRLRDMGWMPATSLRDGLKRTYTWFLQSQSQTA